MGKHGINHYNTHSAMKISIAKRAIRTLMEKLFKHFTLNGTYKWIGILSDIVSQYNNTIYKTIKIPPLKVTKSNEVALLNRVQY